MGDYESEFARFANMAKKIYDHVAVCRAKHGHQEVFTIPFDSRNNLEDFIARNDGDTNKIGFYAKGFSDGEYIGENT